MAVMDISPETHAQLMKLFHRSQELRTAMVETEITLAKLAVAIHKLLQEMPEE